MCWYVHACLVLVVIFSRPGLAALGRVATLVPFC
jgi:hypothetical protein